jgi:hypothetical protein
MMPQSKSIPYGFCHCGCNQKTNAAKRAHILRNAAGELVKYEIGDFYRYKTGHCGRIQPIIENAVPFKIDDVYCRIIWLTKGQFTIVDAADYLGLMQWKWGTTWNPGTKSFYVTRSNSDNGTRPRETVLMHRVIISTDAPHVDHKNHVTLDNRRKNLRPATAKQNIQNSGPYSTNTSGYKGVHKQRNRWKVKVAGAYLGYFSTAIEGAHAYDAEAKRRFGEFAWLNFP